MVRLVLSNLHPGAEAVRTEGEVAFRALDPDQAGLVDIIPATHTQELLTEVERHPPLPPPSCYFQLDLISAQRIIVIVNTAQLCSVLFQNNNNRPPLPLFCYYTRFMLDECCDVMDQPT